MLETEARNRIRKSPVERREASVPDRKGTPHASNGVVWSRLAGATGLRLLGAPLPVWGEGKERNAAPARVIQRESKALAGLFDR